MTQAFTFRLAAAEALKDMTLRRAIAKAVDTATAKRRNAFQNSDSFDSLREKARSVRLDGVENMATIVDDFRRKAESAGATTYFVPDGKSACKTVAGILARRGLIRIVKSKSMITEEIDLSRHLLSEGLSVVETDLGEYIVSLAGEKPSHLTAPAIHKTRRQIGRLFTQKLDIPYTDDPEVLTAAAREKLRGEFLAAQAGITGVNFAPADTGSIVLFTNEGNGRMCSVLPRVHIAVMSPEKVIPRFEDLDVFMKLLPRSATGQTLTTYLSVITGTYGHLGQSHGDELHIVIVDNGRSRIAQGEYREILTCIRCGACINICPVYRSVGGHAYGSTYVGPMGIILSNLLFGMDNYHSLIDACTLCRACDTVCPSLVPLSTLIGGLRRERRRAGLVPLAERIGMASMGAAIGSPLLYGLSQRMISVLHPFIGKVIDKAGFLRRLPAPRDRFQGRFGP